jgi:Protein of unknown function (DUF1553)/Protein of unknown function (DUF1549)
MTRAFFTTLCLLGTPVALAHAAELKLLPREITLSGPRSNHRLIVLAEENGTFVGDRTPQATFSSSNPAVAKVDAHGIVQAAGDGEAVITARHDGKMATAKVKVTGARGESVPSFRNDVIPVLTRVGCNSGACHGALAGKGGFKLSLRGYDPATDHFVITRQAGGRRIDRLEPARSLFLVKPTFALNHGGGRKLEIDAPDFKLLADWVASGAPGPKPDDPKVRGLEVFPAAAVLKPKDRLQVIVRASYTDGTSRDVTRWAKFSSSEDLVAGVNESGLVTVAGHGEAAITVWFSNHVVANRIVSPLSNVVARSVFEKAPRYNFIDDLVLKKLQTLRIPPSSLCSDHEFVRRAFLDATGALPTPQEVEKFIADQSPDKRAKLIDNLLSRAAFIDLWAHKWSDLLLVSSRKLPEPAVWSFYQFVRQSVADNKPWDRFARDVLTAQGSTLRNGAANYFVLHRDVTELTETTAVTFMGMSVTCARCHNHPLEKWTQDQYWSLANLFSRVGLKNGDRTGEVSVQVRPDGDIPHPRRGIPMPPAPLDGKPFPLESRADRRRYFADWLTTPDNPFFAKALVNRVWRNFMGRGLVEAEDDLRQTNPPTNAELFDALARDFVEHRYDIKHLIRTVMNSASYQRSSVPIAGNASDDRFYSHYLVRRLDAEVILDAYSQVTGVPTPFTQVTVGSSGGSKPTKLYPLGTRALQLPDSQLVSPFLEAFGRPDRVQTCSCEREQDSSVGQALHLNNGRTLNDKLRNKKSRVEKWLTEKVSDTESVRRVYLMALSRAPTDAEQKRFTALMAEGAREGSSRREILEDLFWAVLTSKEFIFNR